MQGLGQDLRFGFRMLFKSPGFAAISVLTLALGIGANTAIFSVVDAVLLRPLPYEKPERIVVLWGQLLKSDLPRLSVSQPEYLDYREQARSFEWIAAHNYDGINIGGSEKPEYVLGLNASAELFPLLGVKPALGRLFTAEEDRSAAAPVALVSHGFWQRHMGGRPDAVGTVLMLDGEPTTIVGVMPQGFAYPESDVELWTPLRWDPANLAGRGSHYLRVVARLKDGVTLKQAGAEMDAIAKRLEQDYPDNYQDEGWGIFLVPLHEEIVGNVRPALLLLLAAVAFVLLIACVNVANLLLARAAAREREVAIRASIGAGRARLVRQMLTQSALHATLGGAARLLLAVWGIELLVQLQPGNLPRLEGIGLNSRMLAFTMGVSLLTGIGFGLLPAFQISKPDLTESLKEGARASAGASRRRLSGLLVVAEVALSLILLVGAGLMIRSFSRLLEVNPGFDPQGVATARITLTPSQYTEDAQIVAFQNRLLQRLESLPGVQAAGLASELPLAGPKSSGTVSVEDRIGEGDAAEVEASRIAASPQWFRALGIQLIRGRLFTDADGPEAPGIVVIDEAMARRFWPDADPIGRRIKNGGYDSERPWLTIVGVVRHIKQYGLDIEGREQVYYPLVQRPQQVLVVALRASGDPAAMAGPIRAEVLAVDPQQPIHQPETLTDIVSESVAHPRFSMALLMLFAGLAALLAAVGIYGVMTCSVAQRSHEIGVRMALGAKADDVLRLVVLQGMTLAGAGIVIGLMAAIGLTRLITNLLFQVSALDMATYAGVAVLLTAVAALACWLPARRAAKVDPMVALRYE